MPAALDAVAARVVACQRCPRLVAHRERIARDRVARFRDQVYWGKPVPGFGDSQARVLIVGLAPAAHGANRTGRMFTGDESGNWLYRALHETGFANQSAASAPSDGLRLDDAYITAVARCAPPDNRPAPGELVACRSYLQDELDALSQVAVVVVLGKIAHDGFLAAYRERGHVVASPRPAFGHGRVHLLADGLVLVCSYHPSQQNTYTGRLTLPMLRAVFRRARSEVEKAGRRR